MSISDVKKQESTAANNRAAFPATAAIVDAFRAEFGDGVKLIHAEEGGRTVGRKPPEPKRFVMVDQWLKAGELIKEELARRGIAPMLSERVTRRGRS